MKLRAPCDRIQSPFSIQLILHCILWQKHPWNYDVQTSKAHSSKDGKQKFCRRDFRHTSEKNHFHLALISRLLYSHDCLLVQSGPCPGCYLPMGTIMELSQATLPSYQDNCFWVTWHIVGYINFMRLLCYSFVKWVLWSEVLFEITWWQKWFLNKVKS